MMANRRTTAWTILLMATLAGAIVGCNGIDAAVAVDFYRNEEWRAVLHFSTPVDPSQRSVTEEEIESYLNDLVAGAVAQGVDTHLTEYVDEGFLIYSVEMEGTGLDTLSRAAFQGEAEITIDNNNGGRSLVQFRYNANAGPTFDSLELVLRAGEILDGNGTRLDNRTMQWRNPYGVVEATLMEHSSLSQADADIAVSFYRDEDWQAVMTFSIPADVMSQPGTATQVAGELEEMRAAAEVYGVSAEWHQAASAEHEVYTIQMQGNGLDVLSWLVFSGQAAISVDQYGRQQWIHFQDKSGIGLQYRSSQITLHGGTVMDTNGEWIDNHTVSWDNAYGPVQATLLPSSLLSDADAYLTLDFYRGERWRAILEPSLPAESLFAVDNKAEIERELNELVAQAALANVTAQWREARGLDSGAYVIEMEGTGLDLLSTVVLNNVAMFEVEQTGREPLVHFAQERNGGWEFHSLALEVRGRKIVSGDGVGEGTRRMTWMDASGWTSATIIASPRSLADFAAVYGPTVGIGAAALIGMGLVAIGARKAWKKHQARPPRCPQCGFRFPEDARHCPRCGHDLRFRVCRRCRFQMPADAVFCPQCRLDQRGLVERLGHRWDRWRTSIQAARPRSKGDAAREPGQDEPEPAATSLFPIPIGKELLVGSGPGSDLQLAAPGVATEHAVIRAARRCYFVQDLGSEGGTWVNGQRIPGARKLEKEDVIQIGSVSLVFDGESLVQSHWEL
ncbi:MAG: FHA domain-containing protein [Anaerolineae bacterium]|nr:FHA domain-containing protein [Anaerolineae bacterium]